MKAEILKNMMIDGRKVPAGTIVDVKGWKHAKSLANNRYIRFIEEAPQIADSVEEPKVVKKTPKKEKAE
jgi:hypothetical protein